METLAKNWLTEGLMDFEYKKYVLLAYLKNVHEHFTEQKLYPDFSELIGHFKYLKELKESKETLQANFKKSIENIDLKNLSIQYQMSEDEEWLKEVKEIMDYSLPLMAREVIEGKTIFDYVEKNILLEHLGVLPIQKNEGYFLLQKQNSKRIKVYNYSLSPISFMNEVAYGLKTNYFSSYTLSLSKPIDSIKQELIYQNPYLPHPAVYVFKSKVPLPLEETFLPVAKRLLYNTLMYSDKI